MSYVIFERLRYTLAPRSAGFGASFPRAGMVSFCQRAKAAWHWNDFAVRYGLRLASVIR